MFIIKNRGALVWISVLALVCVYLVHPSRAAGRGPATPPPKQPLDDKSIRALIAQLGDDSFEKREQAEKKLVAAGKAAVGLLKKAVVESGDAEARERAGVVLRAIRARPGPGVWFPEANVIDLAVAVVVFAFAESGAAKVKAQHWISKTVQRFHGVEHDFVVQGSAKQRMRMANHRRVGGVVVSCVEQRFQSSGRALEEQRTDACAR